MSERWVVRAKSLLRKCMCRRHWSSLAHNRMTERTKMPIVDLDFEEELKETNFPDLLEGVPPSVVQASIKKDAARRKVHKERTKSVERRRVVERPSPEVPANIQIAVPSLAVRSSTTTEKSTRSKSQGTIAPSRVAVDPPSSPEGSSGTSNKERRDDVKKSRSTNSTSSPILVQSLVQPGGKPSSSSRSVPTSRDAVAATKSKAAIPVVVAREKKHAAEVVVPKEPPKLTHKSIKRDFIEQVSLVELSPRSLGSALTPPLTSTPPERVLPLTKATATPVPAMSPKHASSQRSAPISSSSSLKTGPSKVAPAVKAVTPAKAPTVVTAISPSLSSTHSSLSSLAHEEEEEEEAAAIKTPQDQRSALQIRQEAQDLLERARDRVARQKLSEQVAALERIVETKNEELEAVRLQLRRAVETKSDLVLAHNEMEKRNLNVIAKKEENLVRMKQANIWLLEAQSIKEKELLNEIIRLTDVTRDQEQKHREELDDWERMHRNEMLEKDYLIAQLTETMRQHGIAIPSPLYQPPKTARGGGGINPNYNYYDPTSIISGVGKFLFH